MTNSLLTRVKSKMFLHSRRRVLHLLDGQYASKLRGRSMDFDDLRDYVPGDEVKDIDWKATARNRSPLVKQYNAERKHRILFAVDRGRNMAAISGAGEPKRDVAVMAMGVLGYLSLRHGDDVGLITGDERETVQLPFRGSQSHLERMLHAAHDHTTLQAGRSDVASLLERVQHTVNKRLMLVVIVDEITLDARLQALVRRLSAQHEIIWLVVRDADPVLSSTDAALTFDVAGTWQMPSFLHDNPDLRREYEYAERKRQIDMEDLFDRRRVSFATLSSEDEVIPELLRMMKMRSYVRH